LRAEEELFFFRFLLSCARFSVECTGLAGYGGRVNSYRQPGSGAFARGVRAWFDLTNADERRVLLVLLTVLLFGLIVRGRHRMRAAQVLPPAMEMKGERR